MSPKMTNPLDWSSLTTFDPAVLNLLDDNVSQPTATQGAMQMDFGFGGTTGLSSNSPYTTIASNPMFMSFASTFDGLTPPESSSTSSPPAASGSSSYNTNDNNFYDVNSLSAWPTSTPISGDPMFEDIFSGYMAATGMDFPMTTGSPSSMTPITHHTTPAGLKAHTSSLGASSSSSPSLLGGDSIFSTPRDMSTPGSEIEHSEKTCPKNKAELQKAVNESGDSPFAPPSQSTLKKSTDSVLGTMITCKGTSFPKTTKSDNNIEVLTAWRSIRANPKFKVGVFPPVHAIFSILIIPFRMLISTSSVRNSQVKPDVTARKWCSSRRVCIQYWSRYPRNDNGSTLHRRAAVGPRMISV